MTMITGYAATFDRADEQFDRVQRGAFLASLARRAQRLPLLWQHQMTEPIGRVVEAREDARGLWFRAEIAASRRALDATALIESGALQECSIGFVPRRVHVDERSEDRDGKSVRVIEQLDLIEISLVTLAANPDARLLTIGDRPQRIAAAPPHQQLGAAPPRTSLADLRRRLRAAVP